MEFIRDEDVRKVRFPSGVKKGDRVILVRHKTGEATVETVTCHPQGFLRWSACKGDVFRMDEIEQAVSYVDEIFADRMDEVVEFEARIYKSREMLIDLGKSESLRPTNANTTIAEYS